MSYGSDIWCTNGLQTGRYARGRTAVVQALFRRLITPRGTLQGGPDEANYGIDLAGYVGAVGYDTALRALPGLVRGELCKDPRVADVSVEAFMVRATDATVSITLNIVVALQDESEPFPFNVSVDETTSELLGVTAAAVAA